MIGAVVLYGPPHREVTAVHMVKDVANEGEWEAAEYWLTADGGRHGRKMLRLVAEDECEMRLNRTLIELTDAGWHSPLSGPPDQPSLFEAVS